MFVLVKYRFISFLRDRTTMFWTFFFPLILCTLFYVTFGNLDNSLECIDTAVIVRSNTVESKAFQTFLDVMAEEGDELLSVQEMSEKEAKEALKKGEIQGIFYADTEPELLVTANGVEESVLQALLESFQSNMEIIQNVSKEKPESLLKLLDRLGSSAMETGYVKEASLGGKETDGMIQYFFSLIAMSCMFGCFLGFEAVIRLQANINPVGARRCVSATSKMKMMLADFIMVCLINFAAVLILIGYMVFILKLDLGEDIGRILLVSFMGCLIGVSMGMLIGSVGKWKESTKIGVMLCISLGSSFLSGLMVGSIKGIIEEYCPAINRINPSSLISDAFYSLSVYQDATRYNRDILIIGIWVVFFMLGSFFMVRRVRYDSI